MGANSAQSIKTDKEIAQSFERMTKVTGSDRAKCKECGFERSWNTTELRKHLAKCIPYQSSLKEQDKCTRSSIMADKLMDQSSRQPQLNASSFQGLTDKK